MTSPLQRGLVVGVATSDEDLAAVARLRRQWRLESGDAGEGAEADYVTSLTRWAREHAPTHQPFLARVAGSPVGIAWLGVVERIPSPSEPVRRAGMVQSVYVVPEQRDSGVGTALLAAVTDEAARGGLAYLMVHPTERSVPFYLRAGFAPADRALELRDLALDVGKRA